MPLVVCEDCGKDISSRSETCIHCGAPAPTGKGNYTPKRPLPQDKIAVLLSQKKKTSHVLHLILSIVTMGFWAIIWALVGLSNYMENARIDRVISRGQKA